MRVAKVRKGRKNYFAAMMMEGLESRTLLSANVVFTPTELASFQSGVGGTGGKPAGLVQDSLGNLYGVTTTGGTSGQGTIFEIFAGSSAIRVLASFSTATGTTPTGGLVVDSNGDVFGTTSKGGVSGNGTLFELVNGSQTITVLESFNASNGTSPTTKLVVDSSDDVFGTTTSGGSFGNGVVFEVTGGTVTTVAVPSGIGRPTGTLVFNTAEDTLFGTTTSTTGPTIFSIDLTGGLGAITTVHSFSSGVNLGANLVVDATSGNLVGTTLASQGTSGTIFELTPGGTLTNVTGAAGNPTGGLVVDSTGNIFGTTLANGNVTASLFQVDTVGGTATTLSSFNTGTQIGNSLGIDTNGNIFGLTSGNATSIFTVNSVTPTANVITTAIPTTLGTPIGIVVTDNGVEVFTQNGGTSKIGSIVEDSAGTVTTRSSFTTSTQNVNGSGPIGLTMDTNGNFFGVTSGGGSGGKGTVFEIAHGTTSVTTLASFTNLTGSNPSGNLVVDATGNLFGVTMSGGAFGRGGIFEIEVGSGLIVNLASFTSASGSPTGAIAIDGSGQIFGTTVGGTGQGGEVFTLTLGVGTASIDSLDSFSRAFTPGNTLVQQGGFLYGTFSGANPTNFKLATDGSVFMSSANFPKSVGTPSGPIAVDASGNVFGVTNSGVIFEVVGGIGTPTVLGKLTGAMGHAVGNIVVDGSGDVFLTTSAGNGQVIEYNAAAHAVWNISTLSTASGVHPSGGLVVSGGHVFGTAKNGGVGGVGGIFDVQLDTTEQRLQITTQPGSVTADNPLGTIVVKIVDPLGNVITSGPFSTSAVTLRVTGAGAPSLSGTTMMNAVAGVATFTGLHLTKSGNYTLTATDGNMVAVASSKFTVTHSAATQVVLTTQPTDAVVGQKFTTVATLEDAEGNTVTNDRSTVTLHEVSSTTLGGVLGGATSVRTSNGVATFSNTVPLTGNYTFDATDGAFTSATSTTLKVTGAPSQVVFTTIPAVTTVAGTAFEVVVTLKDANGAVVVADQSPVTLSFVNAGRAKLSGTLTVKAVNGVATFSGLSTTTAGTFTIKATQGQASASTAITIAPDVAVKLKITSVNSATATNGILVGLNLGPVTVAVEDQFGNVVITDTSSVTLTATSSTLVIVNGLLVPPPAASTVTIAAVNGIATFPAVGLAKAFYNIVATDGTLKSDQLQLFVGFPLLR